MDTETFAMLRETVRRYFNIGQVAERAVQVHAGAGHMTQYKVERFCRDVRLLRKYEGTGQAQQSIIAKALSRKAGLSL